MQLSAAPKTENHLREPQILRQYIIEHAVTILISISDEEFQHVMNTENVLQSVLLYKVTTLKVTGMVGM